MHVSDRNFGDLTLAGVRRIPAGLQKVVEMREAPNPGVLVGYAQSGSIRKAYLFPRPLPGNRRPVAESTLSVDLFPAHGGENLPRKIRPIVAEHGLDPVEVMRELRTYRPSDWEQPAPEEGDHG